MSSPKFQIGEEVILQSRTWPHFSGDHEVLDIIAGKKGNTLYYSGHPYKFDYDGFAYVLNPGHVDVKSGVPIVWKETSLRKKHKPCGMSFDQLMTKIKGKVNV